jgi:hypothetical protein
MRLHEHYYVREKNISITLAVYAQAANQIFSGVNYIFVIQSFSIYSLINSGAALSCYRISNSKASQAVEVI